MAQITVDMIKTLREKTGVGMGKCKEALVEAGGDLEKAVDYLRKKGIASAVKKEGRDANEGMIGTAETGDVIAVVEVNSETDFVANNENFKAFVQQVADEAAKNKPDSLDSFMQVKTSQGETVDEVRAGLIQSIGENIQIKRLQLFPKNGDHSLGVYSHMGGKIVTIVSIEGSNQEESLSKDIAMHVAASNPDYLNPDSVPQDIISREKEIAKEQIKGKPENIIEKILTGKINAFYDQVCLTRQKYIKDDSVTIEELVAKRSKESGKPLTVDSFSRWSLGQTS